MAFLSPAIADDPYARRTVWDEPTQSSLNISVFVFRDSNRNGLYDLGDHPMSGIGVDGEGMGRPIQAFSNSAGFANFKMSGTQSDVDVMFEGRYDFSVLVPSQWSVTTANVTQSIQFRLFPGTPADMVAEPAPALVGMAPDLFINGHLPKSGEAVGLISPEGDRIKLEPETDGSFSLPVRPGIWLANGAASTPVLVESTSVLIADSWWDETAQAAKDRVTVDFEGLQSEGVLKIPSGYAGLGWDNFVMTHRKFYEPQGYRNGVISGEFVAYNGSGHPAAVKRDKPFDFLGGYFAISTLQAEGETLVITGWRGEDQVYRQSLTLSALGPVYLAANFRGITRLDFQTEHFWQFTADDLSFALR